MKNLNVKIIELNERKLVGFSLEMSYANNLTANLWRSFMPRKHEIKRIVNSDLISMQIYPVSFDFSPNINYRKWAAVEVSQVEDIPQGMESYTIQGGLYALIHYKGLSTDTRVFGYIFNEWLPQSEYLLDNNRPHFEVLGEKYKNNDPESEEDIYIPIKIKK